MSDNPLLSLCNFSNREPKKRRPIVWPRLALESKHRIRDWTPAHSWTITGRANYLNRHPPCHRLTEVPLCPRCNQAKDKWLLPVCQIRATAKLASVRQSKRG